MASIKELLQPEEGGLTIESQQSSAKEASPSPEIRHFTIEFVLDTICPHCYIGLGNLQTAIRIYQGQHPETTFEITTSPFILNPGAFRSAYTKQDYYTLTRKFSPLRLVEWTRLGAEIGIAFSWTGLTGNTRDSHKLLRLALESKPSTLRSAEFTHGRHPSSSSSVPRTSTSNSTRSRGPELQFRLVEAIYQGYFEENHDLSDRDWLLDVGKRILAGVVSEDEIRQTLGSETWGTAVDKLVDDVRARGINSVPVFIIQEHYYVGGWQEPQKFLAVFERVRTSGHTNTAI